MVKDDIYNSVLALRESVQNIQDKLDEILLKMELDADEEDTTDEEVLNNKLEELGAYINNNIPDHTKYLVTIRAVDMGSMDDNVGVLFTTVKIHYDSSVKSIEIPVAITDLDGSIAEAKYRVVSEQFNRSKEWIDFKSFVTQIIDIVNNFDNVKSDPISPANKLAEHINNVIANCIKSKTVANRVDVKTSVRSAELIDFKIVLELNTKFTVYHNGEYVNTIDYDYTVFIPKNDMSLNTAKAKQTCPSVTKYIKDILNKTPETDLWSFVSVMLQTTIDEINSLFVN